MSWKVSAHEEPMVIVSWICMDMLNQFLSRLVEVGPVEKRPVGSFILGDYVDGEVLHI